MPLDTDEQNASTMSALLGDVQLWEVQEKMECRALQFTSATGQMHRAEASCVAAQSDSSVGHFVNPGKQADRANTDTGLQNTNIFSHVHDANKMEMPNRTKAS